MKLPAVGGCSGSACGWRGFWLMGCRLDKYGRGGYAMRRESKEGKRMKRVLCLLCCLAMLLCALPSAARAGGGGVSDVMRVVNCSEWVSLREFPDTKSKRLAMVYLGELVNQCSWYNDEFALCDYHGKTGYILLKYLQMTAFTNYDEIMYNQMVVNCEEWASLRELPDTTSRRLAKVPIGAVVVACVKEGDAFVRCEYKKQVGYIAAAYLKKANYTVTKQDSKVVSKAQKAGYTAYRNPMTVVNTADWVSLREKASASSSRLARVPLGAQVSHCIQVSGQFVYCQYKNVWGYIKTEYLRSNDPRPTAAPAALPVPQPVTVPTVPALPTAAPAAPLWMPSAAPQPESAAASIGSFDHLPELPSYVAFQTAGETVVNFHAGNGYTVVTQRSTDERDAEEIMAVCYDLTGRPLWTVRKLCEEKGELHGVDAFIAGTEETPLLVLFCAGQGFTAYGVDGWGIEKWAVEDEAAKRVSGGITTAVDADGTVYAIGFHDAAPICISPEGSLRWAAVNDRPDVYWPQSIRILEDRIQVYYETPVDSENMCDVLSFTKEGARIMLQRMPRPSQEQTV